MFRPQFHSRPRGLPEVEIRRIFNQVLFDPNATESQINDVIVKDRSRVRQCVIACVMTSFIYAFVYFPCSITAVPMRILDVNIHMLCCMDATILPLSLYYILCTSHLELSSPMPTNP